MAELKAHSSKMKRLVILFAFCCLVLATTGASAGILVVSGDTNIANAIDGSDETGTAVPGNSIFFGNLIGVVAGRTVDLQSDPLPPSEPDQSEGVAALTSLYRGLSNTVNVTSGFPSTLNGVALYIAYLPGVPFTSSQITELASFLNGGSTVLLLGEYAAFDSQDGMADANINALLAALGSPMQLAGTYGHGFEIINGAQIASNPLTTGVTGFGYADTSSVTGGTPLFLSLSK